MCLVLCAGSALVALLQHMQKLPACPDCRNHLFLLSSSFAGCVNNPRMQKVLQVGQSSLEPTQAALCLLSAVVLR
jgi:hypothetical protein